MEQTKKRDRETMEDADSPMNVRRWEDMDPDILRMIFEYFGGISDLTSAIAHVRCGGVCSAWRSVFRDSLRWDSLDLSTMKSVFIHTQKTPYVYVHRRSDFILSGVLKVALSLSLGNIINLMFNLGVYVWDDLLTYTAERCPKLRRLVMPDWNRIKQTGICKAIRCWKDLESLTMPTIEDPQFLMKEISKNCKKFRELKIMGTCDIRFAWFIAAYLPNLKVLSLRCTKLTKKTLIMILDGLQHLQVLNISHCLVLDEPSDGRRRILEELDPNILEKASRLQRFITCMQFDHCVMCQRTKKDEGIMRWYRYEEGRLWKADEVNSLAL